MVTKLAPVLGISLHARPVAHELMRILLQDSVSDRAGEYRRLVDEQRYNVHLPTGSPPMWWAHLVLIYFKRLYLNRPELRLCPARPVCDAVLDCRHSGQPDISAPIQSLS